MKKNMKFGIEKLVYEIEEKNIKEIINNLLNGDPFEDLSYSECDELIDDRKEAEEKFEKLTSSIRIDESGEYIVERYFFDYGEAAIDQDILEDDGEEVYFLESYTIEKRAPFDDKSVQILKELGIETYE